MAIKLSVAARNARLDAFETAVGGTAVLKIWNGALPADCAAADAGTVLATMTLPADWMAAASSGAKALAGAWTDGTADASGTAVHFRIYNNTGTVCFMQGTVGQGSGDLSLDNTSIAAGQAVTITTFTLTDGNA
jgi:hypothetical protein